VTERKVVFIAFQEQENLGVGYLSSILLSKGFNVETLDFQLSHEELYRQLKMANPFLVGFSLIFQYYNHRLRDLSEYLRQKGVNCHFTVGGHYPSLRFEDVLNNIPALDSVVRFEGEYTICELAERLITSQEWTEIKGIAYRKNGKPISNDLRSLIENLDVLPFPLRNNERKYTCMEKNCAFILANRGCVWNCSFCSIRKFYGTPPGRIRRSRSPENVVKEIKELYEKSETRIFLFQDDDFISRGKLGKEWINSFIDKLEQESIAEKILWKISCRSDEVDFDLFLQLKKAGLCLVYLGIESGNSAGLQIFSKHLTVEDSVRAVKNLNALNILWEFGFMLFDPSSTFQSIRANIDFLKDICDNGCSPITFCKMIPYAGTDIERMLITEGRLRGSIVTPDYDFLDPRIDGYCRFLQETFHEWMFTRAGLLASLRWHQFEIKVLEKFYPSAKGLTEYKDFVKRIIISSNALFIKIAKVSANIFEKDSSDSESHLLELARAKLIEQESIKKNFIDGMRNFQRLQSQLS
jgi:anaerobic magnesium-protoporphyrin IX monomethyl ester cyclase